MGLAPTGPGCGSSVCNNLGVITKQWGGLCRTSLGMVRPTACDNLSPR
jgi:hypothetical protein